MIDAYLNHLSFKVGCRRIRWRATGATWAISPRLPRERRRRSTLGRRDLEAFVRSLMTAGRSPRSVGRAVATVRGFTWFLAASGRVGADPADDSRATRLAGASEGMASKTDRLLEAPDPSTPRGLRDRARSSSCCAATGLRVSELVALRPADVNLEAGYLTCTGKGEKQRMVPIGQTAAAWVARYMREARSTLLHQSERTPA